MLYPADTPGKVITSGEAIIDWSKGKLRLYALDINQRAHNKYFSAIAREQ
jgi:hypothetical protein